MSEVDEAVSRFIALAESTASFRNAIGHRGRQYVDEKTSSVAFNGLQELSASVEHFTIDGWHLIDPEASALLMRQMADNRNAVGVNCQLPSPCAGDAVRLEYWNDRWIPLFAIEHGLLCIDLEPGPGGRVGQIIRVSTDGGDRRLVADSFADFCRRVVDAFDAGDLVLEDHGDGPEIFARDGYSFFVW